MAELGEANIGGRMVPAWLVGLTAEELDSLKSRWYSNPNLLDNWYFGNPVNQRGNTIYGHTPQYCIDRWKINNDYAFVDVNDGYITIRGNDINGYGGIIQKLEDSAKTALLGKTVTLSVLMKPYTALNLAGIGVCEGADSAFGLYSVTFTGTISDYVLLNAKIPVTLGEPIVDVLAIKLELGTHQTLAHQDENGNWVLNEIPNYAEELAKCQRYFVRIRPSNNSQTVANGIIDGSLSSAWVRIVLPSQLRTLTPAISINAGGHFTAINANTYVQTPLGINATLYGLATNEIQLGIPVASTKFDALGYCTLVKDSNSYIDIIADL